MYVLTIVIMASAAISVGLYWNGMQGAAETYKLDKWQEDNVLVKDRSPRVTLTDLNRFKSHLIYSESKDEYENTIYWIDREHWSGLVRRAWIPAGILVLSCLPLLGRFPGPPYVPPLEAAPLVLWVLLPLTAFMATLPITARLYVIWRYSYMGITNAHFTKVTLAPPGFPLIKRNPLRLSLWRIEAVHGCDSTWGNLFKRAWGGFRPVTDMQADDDVYECRNVAGHDRVIKILQPFNQMPPTPRTV